LLQKDPKFRYATAAATAEVLEAWSAKNKAQRVLQVAKGGSESSLNLGDEAEPATGSKLGSAVDTVSNRGGDTVAGRSSDGLSLSPSDSGVLVRVERKSGDSDSGSTIDLEAEIGRRTNASRGGSSASGSSTKGPAFVSPALKNSGAGSVSVASAHKAAPAQALPEKGVSRFLLIVGLILMFILAIFLGGVIAVLTIPGRGNPTNSGSLQLDSVSYPQSIRTT